MGIHDAPGLEIGQRQAYDRLWKLLDDLYMNWEWRICEVTNIVCDLSMPDAAEGRTLFPRYRQHIYKSCQPPVRLLLLCRILRYDIRRECDMALHKSNKAFVFILLWEQLQGPQDVCISAGGITPIQPTWSWFSKRSKPWSSGSIRRVLTSSAGRSMR